jgi:hypothetical protein
VEAKHTAARARVLAAFTARDGFEDDGHGSARTWLRWQTRVTSSAAAGAVGWARRLAAHPVLGDALAAGEVTASWARRICEWTDLLPPGQRGDADEILVAAARAGVGLAGLGGLAREMAERSRAPAVMMTGSRTGICGWGSPSAVRAGPRVTWRRGARRRWGRCWGALGTTAGPEDTRTAGQRRP